MAGGNQNTMANYLPVVLSPTIQDWLTGLPANSINSWRDLCTRFIDNFQGTFAKPGVEWDLNQIGQRKDECNTLGVNYVHLGANHGHDMNICIFHVNTSALIKFE